MKKTIRFLILTFLCLFFLSRPALARENISDWYIKDFKSEIIVNKDSSLSITENIIADCGNLYYKHGIFRILPTQYENNGTTIKTKILLENITDFEGKEYNYKTINNRENHTITWQIGDPNKEVQGENFYKISYKILNTAITSDPNKDELFLNLNGSFWTIDTDKYSAKITFPDVITKNNSSISLFSGSYGVDTNNLASYNWTGDHTIQIKANKPLLTNQGVTLSTSFPKNIISAYKPQLSDYSDEMRQLIWLVFPILILAICFIFWSIYGRDPRVKDVIVPEFSVPGDFAPLELGMLYSNGKMNNRYVTAAIVNLAIKGIITIEKIKLNDSEDYKIKMAHYDPKVITDSERHLINGIFGIILDKEQPLDQSYKYEISISELKRDFYHTVEFLQNYISADLEDQFLLDSNGRAIKKSMLGLAGFIILIYLRFFLITDFGLIFSVSVYTSIAILILFSIIMPKRTMRELELYKKILGFRLYLKTAEKNRQQFLENENIFEKILPYAIMFGLTDKWTSAMNTIYQEKFGTILPTNNIIWLMGIDYNTLNIDSFAGQLRSLSEGISSIIPQTSGGFGGFVGGGGGGFSGGGSGGGGGGGW